VTNEGQMFYERAKQILADLDEAETALIPQSAALTGSLRLTAPVHFGENYIAPVLADFISSHEDLVVDIELLDRHVNLVEEGFDLAVRIGELPDSSLIVRKLFHVASRACASASYIEQFGQPEEPDRLDDHRGLFHRSGANLTEWSYINKDGQQRRATPSARMISNDDHVLLHAAIAGLGIIWVPEFIVKEVIAKGQLVEVMPDVNWIGHNAYAVYPPTRHLSNRVRACVDFLVTRFSDK
jgi:DNA-binding transcriptional LysR family regulator